MWLTHCCSCLLSVLSGSVLWLTACAGPVPDRAGPGAGDAAPATAGPEWRSYAGNVYKHKYSSLDQITPANVADLEIAWRWRSPSSDLAPRPSGSVQFSYQTTPLFIDSVLYASTTASQLAAIDPLTGDTMWTFDPGTYQASEPSHGMFMHRGVSYWEEGGRGRILFGHVRRHPAGDRRHHGRADRRLRRQRGCRPPCRDAAARRS